MTSTPDQTARIRQKLTLARRADRGFKVFGASSHKYKAGAPAAEHVIAQFEATHAVDLPEAYRAFLRDVGNGGVGFQGSGPGPYYGLYPLGSGLDDLATADPAAGLARPCVLSPGMAPSEWTALIADLERDALDEDAVAATLCGGLLPLGSQGCGHFQALVLNGPFAGRVVNLEDGQGGPPKFAYEPDFLAWYERWLDEVIAGDLEIGPAWFGYLPGGSEATLLEEFLASTSAQARQEILEGLLAKRRLGASTLGALVRRHAERDEHRPLICQAVCKSDADAARPLLAELGQRDPLAFLQCLHRYAKARIPDWQEVILSCAGRITDQETVRVFIDVLEHLPVERGAWLVPFARSEHAANRITALHALGKVKDRRAYLDVFIAGLEDADNHVVRTALQALAGLKDKSLVAHYRRVAARFPVEQDHVLATLGHRLKEHGLSGANAVPRKWFWQ